MKDIIPAKKQSPILGLTGMGGGVGSNIVAGLAKDTPYVDEVFSTYLYNGTQGSNTATTGLDMTKGGMVWYKSRSASNTQNLLTDTVRGANKVLYSDAISGENNDTGLNQTFTNTGWTLNNGYSDANSGSNTYTSWNFRKREGFFDVVTYTGNGSNRTINHNLGSVPGSIWIKQLDGSGEWICYHRGVGAEKFLQLNNIEAENDDATAFQDTAPTASVFSLGTHAYVNGNGNTYVAYVFAGGESPDALARSVNFSGNGQTLSLASSSDFDFGTGDFTIECWGYRESGQAWTCFDHLMGSDHFIIFSYANGDIRVYAANGGGMITTSVNPGDEKWFHLAVVRESGELKFYIDGVKASTVNFTLDITQAGVVIGAAQSGLQCRGLVSNLRIVKGTAVYTTNFKPPTAGLTAITNTVLLCCNNSSTTGSTVTPGTITANGSVSASTNSPFDDPNGFKFGEDEDQSIIKCGVYGGNSSTDGPDIYLGWEPQWILFKVISKTDPWYIADTTRRIATGGVDNTLLPNSTQAENDGNWTLLDVSSTGWKPTTADSKINGNGHRYVYIAMRRPDGYVGKPAEAGTDVFTMDTGNGSTTGPAFDSNFAVDMAIKRNPTSAHDWGTHFRLTGPKDLRTNTNDVEGNDTAGGVFDYMNGVSKGSHLDSSYQAWMWKRHAGFDVVAYKGNGIHGTGIPHSMNKVPEMMWVKGRDNSGGNWYVYHKGLNGGVNPWEYSIPLNSNNAETATQWTWNDTAPTSTHFTLRGDNQVNGGSYNYVAMLFASIDGISKCGYYTGDGSSNRTITTGFQPRFLILKSSDNALHWYTLDDLRGWTVGNTGADNYLRLNNNVAQSQWNFGAPTTTGFTLPDNDGAYNANGNKYFYYAHA